MLLDIKDIQSYAQWYIGKILKWGTLCTMKKIVLWSLGAVALCIIGTGAWLFFPEKTIPTDEVKK